MLESWDRVRPQSVTPLDTARLLNEHSFMPTSVASRRAPSATARPERPDKRDALLRAAIDTFAARGFFNAQVADVARSAGVAAGTVYLYFRGKDDLLISIFERTMKEAIAEGRRSIAGLTDPVDRLREIARLHLGRLGRDRALAVVFQVELRQSTKFMERFSATQLREYPRDHPRHHRRRSGATGLPARHQPDAGRQAVLWRARRDGHELDSQPPQIRAGG